MTLDVNLDGSGPAERTGTLWARDFLVLGDPVITEVLQNADGSPQPGSRRTVVREQFEFEIMRVPFEVGHGQFVMHEATIRGVLVSAHMSGKVDFRRQALDIGGTYVPMSGLMRVPAEIPIFGPLLTGPRGEGLFGITFGIKGSMARPQVIVNPLSLITPGIFREVFQMTPEDLRIIPRERPAPPRKDGSRASSAPAAIPPGGASAAPAVTPEVGGSWSAEAGQPPSRSGARAFHGIQSQGLIASLSCRPRALASGPRAQSIPGYGISLTRVSGMTANTSESGNCSRRCSVRRSGASARTTMSPSMLGGPCRYRLPQDKEGPAAWTDKTTVIEMNVDTISDGDGDISPERRSRRAQ